MSVKTRKRVKNIGKFIGVALFAFLMFTNIKIALMDSSELANGDISLFGITVTLFDATDAYDDSYGHYETWIGNCEETDTGLLCWYNCMVGDPPECTGGGYGYAN